MLPYNVMWAIVNRWQIEMRVTCLRDPALLVYGIIQSQIGVCRPLYATDRTEFIRWLQQQGVAFFVRLPP